MFAIFKKELLSLFGNIGTYIIASIFIIINVLFLWIIENDTNQFNVFQIQQSGLSSFFALSPWILMFLIPALTMKLIAEEENKGTLQWLFSQPISLYNLIIGKFLAVLVFIFFCLISTFYFIWTVYELSMPAGNIDLGIIFSGYLGLVLLSAAFISIGIFASSLTANQVLAYIIGVFLCFLAYFGFEGLASYNLLGKADYIVRQIGFYYHFQGWTKGLIDTRDIAYFLLVIILFIGLTYTSINQKK